MHQAKKWIGCGALAILAVVVPKFEGKRNTAYRDVAGILTICYGHTGHIRRGQTATDEQCRILLEKDLAEALRVVDQSVTTPMSEPRRAGLASFVFNVGETKFKRSTLLRKLNAGDKAACEQLMRWVYVYVSDSTGDAITDSEGGRYVFNQGLANRRAAEKELCEYE